MLSEAFRVDRRPRSFTQLRLLEVFRNRSQTSKDKNSKGFLISFHQTSLQTEIFDKTWYLFSHRKRKSVALKYAIDFMLEGKVENNRATKHKVLSSWMSQQRILTRFEASVWLTTKPNQIWRKIKFSCFLIKKLSRCNWEGKSEYRVDAISKFELSSSFIQTRRRLIDSDHSRN